MNLAFLGSNNPTQLSTTLLFLLGIHCALTAGKEHHGLRSMALIANFHLKLSMANMY